MTAAAWYALAIALIAACIAGLVVYAARLDGGGGHTHRNVRRRAADPFDGAGDPDDPGFAADWRPAGRFPYIISETDEPSGTSDSCQPDWWDEDEPDAGWQSQAAAAPDRLAQTAQLTTTVLERVREGLLSVEPDGTSATFTPAPGVAMPVSDDSDITGVQPHAVTTWGKTADQLAAELEAEHFAERYMT